MNHRCGRRNIDLESRRKELIEYLRTFDIVLFAMFLVFGIIGLVTVIVVGVPGLMFIIPAAVAFFNWLGKYMEASGLVGKLEKEGEIDRVLSDFKNGEKFLGGRLIRGDFYIMSRGTGKVLKLSEVARISDHRKKNGFAGDSRQLLAEMEDGRNYELTYLSLKGKDDEDIKRLCYK